MRRLLSYFLSTFEIVRGLIDSRADLIGASPCGMVGEFGKLGRGGGRVEV